MQDNVRHKVFVAIAGAFSLVSSVVNPQTAPRFEAVSIKPSPASSTGSHSEGGPGWGNPERFRSTSNSLAWLIRLAYDIKGYQLIAPDWTQTTRFDVEAKIPPAATNPQFRLMLQAMLAERLQLKVHQEKREGDVYELTNDKNNSKLKERSSAGNQPIPSEHTADGAYRGSFTILRSDRATIHAANEPVSFLINQLRSYFDLPVNDATALTGKYDFELSWTPDPLAVAPDALPLPALVDAVRQQLGLRLTRKKGMIDMTVVDYVERTPTAN